jgi:CTP:phosphocholine cytidylyltransferase-like protein
MKRNAIIIAAGTSSRFVPLSYEKPKGLVDVKGEVLIERPIRQLHEAGGNDVTIVVGYMAEQFAYLGEKYGVQFVKNEDYTRYNNTSSMIRVVDRLFNTYICCSDQYYEKNPFLQDLQQSAYAALYAAGKTNEYCLELDKQDGIRDVQIGGADAWYMAGFAYFSEDFSKKFGEILTREYAHDETKQMYWEDVYIKHLLEMPTMQVVRFADEELREFDSLDELRMFDKTYVDDTRSAIVKAICQELQCRESELSGFKKTKETEGQSFTFRYKGTEYLYKNGELTKC